MSAIAAAADQDWRARSACAADPAAMWPETPDGATAPAEDPRWAAATKVCATCPVLASCLAYGASHPSETHGTVLGGMTPWQWQTRRRAARYRAERARAGQGELIAS